jgi:hypothetical protein
MFVVSILAPVLFKLYRIVSPVASSISSPALPAISAELKIPPGSILENMSLSIFVLAYALGVSREALCSFIFSNSLL